MYGENGAGLKSDIWALGITLIELAERRNPYQDYTSPRDVMDRILNYEPPTLSSSKWTHAFVDFVSKCLVKDENARWNATQLMDVRSSSLSNE